MMRNRPTARPCPSAPLGAVSHIGRALSPPSELEARQIDSHNRSSSTHGAASIASARQIEVGLKMLIHVLFLHGFRILCPYRNSCLSDPWDKVSALALVGISCALFRMLRDAPLCGAPQHEEAGPHPEEGRRPVSKDDAPTSAEPRRCCRRPPPRYGRWSCAPWRARRRPAPRPRPAPRGRADCRSYIRLPTRPSPSPGRRS